MSDGSSCRHFSLSNPEDDGADDPPRLLRRMADVIEEYGIRPVDILDFTVSQEIVADGPWWSVTVYWSPEEEGEAGKSDR